LLDPSNIALDRAPVPHSKVRFGDLNPKFAAIAKLLWPLFVHSYTPIASRYACLVRQFSKSCLTQDNRAVAFISLLGPNSSTRTPATDTTNGRAHNNSTTNLPYRNARAQHLDMSRCWDVANFCALVVSNTCELVLWWCSLLVFVAGVRVVEFGPYRSATYQNLKLEMHDTVKQRFWTSCTVAIIIAASQRGCGRDERVNVCVECLAGIRVHSSASLTASHSSATSAMLTSRPIA